MDFSEARSFGPKPHYPLVRAYSRKDISEFKIIAGPCSYESVEHSFKMAKIVSDAGATHFRSGVFRAGTYPGLSFGWLDEESLNQYSLAAKVHGLRNIIEVLDYSTESLDLIAPYCDVFQVGARSMQNYTLLRKLGRYEKPVFLKRAAGATIDEFLGSAEHILTGGVRDLTLIERGGSSNHRHVRWDLSISMIPAIKTLTAIPIIVDASHGTGRRDLVPAMTLAGIAAGADGALIEVHDQPERSISDAEQAIDPETFSNLITRIKAVRSAIECDV